MTAEYKMTLTSIDPQTATGRAKDVLESALKQVGFIPNMYANMANAPGLLETYLHGYALFRRESGLTPQEQEVVFLVISRENHCEYCVGAHSFIADVVSKVPVDVTNAIRDGVRIPDEKLSALAAFTQLMVTKRGLPSSADVGAFLSAGYSEEQLLYIVLAIAVKTLSNYSNHVFHTQLDSRFQARAWH